MSEHWRNAPMTSFDLETTGVDVTKDRVVTATVLHVVGKERGVRNWLIDPGVEIPEGAAKIHGVTTERARAEGVMPSIALVEIRDALLAAWDRGEPVVIYNAPFDLSMLDCELARHGHVRLPAVLGPVIDPLVIDKFNDPFRKGSRKLIDCARHYGVTLSEQDAHTSEGDTLAAARLAYKACGPEAGARVRVAGWGRDATYEDRRGVVHAMSLHELAKAQVEWAAEQKRGFAEYKAKTGQHAVAEQILAEIGWPIRPLKLASEPPPM